MIKVCLMFCDNQPSFAAASNDYSVSESPLTRQFTSSDRMGTVKCISVRIVNDNISDPDETFTVRISSTDLRVEIRQVSTTVIIIDDDGVSVNGCMYL